MGSLRRELYLSGELEKAFCERGHLEGVPEDGKDFHRIASSRIERKERCGVAVFEAQGIIPIGCDREEIEGRAAKLGWGHVTQDLECQGGESVVKWKGSREPGTVVSKIRVAWQQYGLWPGAGWYQ